MLSIGFSPSGLDAGETPGRQIIVGHFKFQMISIEQAREGFRHCPGLVLVMPRSDQESFSVNGDPLVLPPGSALVLNGESHNVLVADADSDRDVDGHSNLGIIEVNAVIDASFRLRDVLSPPFWLNVPDSKEVTDVFHNLIYSDCNTRRLADTNDLSLYVHAARIVDVLLRAAEEVSTEPDRGKGAVQLDRLRRYLQENLSNKITTANMAAHLGLTHTHFCKRAKSLLGETPMSCLRRIRLERSLEMLEHTDDSIDAIAFLVGYADRFGFSKEFKRRYRVSPAQYRRQSAVSSKDESYLKALALFENQRHEHALSVCGKALSRTGEEVERDQMIYLKGRCLFALGRSEEALEAWDRLDGGDYAWRAGIRRCQLHFKYNHYDDALSELNTLWNHADGLKRNDLIQTWIEQVNAIIASRRAKPLSHYLEFRKENFVADPQSKATAIHACRCLGDTTLILQHCLDDKHKRFIALRGAGDHEQALDLYGSQVRQTDIARTHLEAGHYQQVLSLIPELPVFSAKALVHLGRPEEAIERFPEDCLDAYLELKRYRDALDHSSADSLELVYALHGSGRKEELKTFYNKGTWLWHLAQLYLRPEYLLKQDYPQSHLFLPKARLLAALKPGLKPEDTLSILNPLPRIESTEFWPPGLKGGDVLLRHVIPALLGEMDSLEPSIDVILSKWRRFDKQRLYYDAAYLAGTISLETWRTQPVQLNLADRETFIQSLNHDLRGRGNEALKGYRTFIENASTYGVDKLLTYRFVEWRLHMTTMP